MIELASIKTSIEIIKQVTDIVTGAKKSSDEEFDTKINAMFQELELVAGSYFSLFSELRTIVKSSHDKESLDAGIDIILTKRDQLVLDRNKLSGSLSAYRSILAEKGFSEPVYSSNNHLLMFLSDVDAFFYEPFGQGTSQFTLLLDALSQIQKGTESFEDAKQKSLELIKFSCSDLEHYWKKACENFEHLKSDKSEVLRLLSK